MFFQGGETEQEKRAFFRDYVEKNVFPYAEEFDEIQQIPREYFKKLANDGFLGTAVSKKYGGSALDDITLGIMHEEFGRGYGSVENAITVYGMVCRPLSRLGTKAQKEKYLPKVVSGEWIPAIGITEPNAGSNMKGIETSLIEHGYHYVLNGKKRYITLAQIADFYIIIAKLGDLPTACIIDRDTKGLSVSPILGLLGLRANMLAELNFDNCVIPKESILGKPGDGIRYVAGFALNEGRFTTACGALGIAQGCLELSMKRAKERIQFDMPLMKHELVQKMLTEMITSIEAARGVCQKAARLREEGEPEAVQQTLIAKYLASQAAVQAGSHAVSIHGASGCTENSAAQRGYRDAKIMELIEGSTQIYEEIIPKGYQMK